VLGRKALPPKLQNITKHHLYIDIVDKNACMDVTERMRVSSHTFSAKCAIAKVSRKHVKFTFRERVCQGETDDMDDNLDDARVW